MFLTNLANRLRRSIQSTLCSTNRSSQNLPRCYSTDRQKPTSSKPRQIQVRSANLGSNKKDTVKGGKEGGVWQSWLNLSLGTKMGVAFGIGAVGVVGLLASDYLERQMPVEGNSNNQQNSNRKPRLLGISVVDREERTK